MRNRISIILTVTLLLCTIALQAQVKSYEKNEALRVKTQDGSELNGRFVFEDKNYLVINNAAFGEIRVLKANIIEVERLKIQNEDDLPQSTWFINPNHTRYLVAPSALPMDKGERYYQNIYVILSGIQYGITDRLSIGGGFSVTSLFGFPAAYITPKYTIYSEGNLHLATGVIAFFASSNWQFNENNSAGIGYISGSLGNKEHNISLGVGWGYVNRDLAEMPIINVAGQTRIRKKISLVSENWLLPNINSKGSYYGIHTYGMRFLSEEFAIDLSLINNPEIFEISRLGIPYLGVMVKF